MARIALVIAALLVTAAPAHADVTIGSALPPPSGGTESCGGGCTFSNTAIAGGQAVAPTRGIITRWRIRGGPAAPVRLVVLRRPSGAGGPAELSGRSAEVTPAADAVTVFDARIPIIAGEYIGIELSVNVTAAYFANVATSPRDTWTPPVAPDGSPTPNFSGGGREVLVNADIEPDVDGDGLGDTTQDADDDGDGIADGLDGCPTTAGPAPSGCPTPPNQAPTVGFRAPLSGAGVGPSVQIALDAADDRGSPTVTVFDDDGPVCTLTAAPFTCTWTPTGADVGRATLLASAVDSDGASSLAIVRVHVNRFAAALTGKARRHNGRTTVTGKLVLPAVVTRAQGCKGNVTVRVKKARKTVPLSKRCAYSAVLGVRTGKPRVTFAGNPVIAPT